jgi:hypothetical protein
MFRVGVSATDHLLALFVCSKVLKTREEFVNTANLGAVDILAVRLWLDRKVRLLFDGVLHSNWCYLLEYGIICLIYRCLT